MSHLSGLYDLTFSLFLPLTVAFILYFLPTFIAFYRRHPNRWQIFAGDLLLGWTFVFWCLLLMSALASRRDD